MDPAAVWMIRPQLKAQTDWMESLQTTTYSDVMETRPGQWAWAHRARVWRWLGCRTSAAKYVEFIQPWLDYVDVDSWNPADGKNCKIKATFCYSWSHIFFWKRSAGICVASLKVPWAHRAAPHRQTENLNQTFETQRRVDQSDFPKNKRQCER